MKAKVAFLSVIVALFAVSCSSSSSNDQQTAATTRTIQGKIAAPAAAMTMVKAEVAGTCTSYDPAICKVIATATDGTTVSDENLSDCAFSLPLVVGSDYVISFVGTDAATGACDKFVATLIAGGSAIFRIEDGTEFDLGDVTIDPTTGSATASNTFSGMASCAELDKPDSDGNGVCDDWQEEFPEGWTGPSSPGGETTTIDDVAGTYNLTAVNGTNACDDVGAYAYTETITVTGGKVTITDTPDATHLFNNDETAHPTSDLLFTETADGYSLNNIILAEGCPLYDSSNTFTFDTSVTPFTLTRTVDEITGGTAGVDPLEGCEAVYTKQ